MHSAKFNFLEILAAFNVLKCKRIQQINQGIKGHKTKIHKKTPFLLLCLFMGLILQLQLLGYENALHRGKVGKKKIEYL